MLDSELIEVLFKAEGKERYAYQDINGYWTIGVGRCIDKRCANGLSDNEIKYLLNNDIQRCKAELLHYPFYVIETNPVRIDALLELNFAMGLPKFLSFKKMLSAWLKGDYNEAASQLLDSNWARLLPVRAKGIAERIRNGHY